MSAKDTKIKDGWLIKKGGRRRNWNKRYFVLTSKVIAYYTKKIPIKRHQKGSIPINLIESVFLDQHQNTVFKILTPSRLYILRAESSNEATSWIEKLHQTVGESRFITVSPAEQADIDRRFFVDKATRETLLKSASSRQLLSPSHNDSFSMDKVDTIALSLANLKFNIMEKKRPLPAVPKEDGGVQKSSNSNGVSSTKESGSQFKPTAQPSTKPPTYESLQASLFGRSLPPEPRVDEDEESYLQFASSFSDKEYRLSMVRSSTTLNNSKGPMSFKMSSDERSGRPNHTHLATGGQIQSGYSNGRNASASFSTVDDSVFTDDIEMKPFKVCAIYSFDGVEEDDLSFKKGDIITVLEKDEVLFYLKSTRLWLL
eukprot:TRINITY_DN3064_c0_g2_i2.p1 TRINITY_DN3064_c0_g2~~TRINITY_DN3064_c0_g2_i2.p1  ORF type:complete len:371 (+),score=67.43 TRINITY_DN3064_c0_g2_i2:46-1158(+)